MYNDNGEDALSEAMRSQLLFLEGERVKPTPVALGKLDWLDRAIQIYNYHTQCLREDKKWTIEKTAISLNRSVGSVSQDITIASWYPTHGKQLKKFSSMNDALEWVRLRKAEMRTSEIKP